MEIIDTVYMYRLSAGEKLFWHGRYHSHDEMQFEIHFFSEGEGSFLSNRTTFSIRNNSIFLCGPHEFHSILPKEVRKPLTYYSILFSVDEGDRDLYAMLMNSLASKKNFILTKEQKAGLTFMLNDIMQLSRSESDDFKKSAAYLLASCLFRLYANSEKKSPSPKKPVTARDGDFSAPTKTAISHVNMAIKFMERKVYETCTVEDVAKHCLLSKEHFIRTFKLAMQMTPHQYFMRLKIQTAALALINSNASISQVAEDFAFENQFHFSRVFKKCTGLAPSAYRVAYTNPQVP